MNKDGFSFSGFKRMVEVSWVLARARFILRNEGTWLGILWYLLVPLLTFVLMLSVFKNNLGISIPHYPLYLLIGVLMFNCFSRITTEATMAIRGNAGLIKAMNFPRSSLVLSLIFTQLLAHIAEIIVLIIFLKFFHIPILVSIAFYLLILFFFLIFIFGLSLILSALTIYFVDLYNVWVFGIGLFWFATPIFYKGELQGGLLYLNLFNPVWHFITIARDVMIYHKSPEAWVIVSALSYCVIFLLAGILVFNKLNSRFAELI